MSKKEIKKQSAILQKFESKDFMGILKEIVVGGSAEEIMREFSEEFSSLIDSKNKKTRDNKKLGEISHKAIYVYGLETHSLLSETVEKKYRGFATEFSRQLIEEHNCKTAGEKALA